MPGRSSWKSVELRGPHQDSSDSSGIVQLLMLLWGKQLGLKCRYPCCGNNWALAAFDAGFGRHFGVQYVVLRDVMKVH